jgi:hypothetical protein
MGVAEDDDIVQAVPAKGPDQAFVTLSITDVVAVGLLFLGGELLVSRILYALKVRDRPY